MSSFEEHAAERSARAADTLALGTAVAILLFWPTDFLLFPDSPATIKAFAGARLVTVLVSTGAWWGMRSSRALRRRATELGVAGLITISLSCGWFFSDIGGLEEPWFHMVNGVVAMTLLFHMELPARFAAAAAVGLAWSLGFFGHHPEHLAGSTAPSTLIFLAFVTTFSTWIGHRQHELARENFEQGRALAQANERVHQLLLNVMPAPVAERLLAGQQPLADGHDAATVLFADIVGFTRFSEGLDPRELVMWLNAVFSQLDRLAEKHGLEKIKTVGDAYMVVGGVTGERSDHAEAVAAMALEMQALASTLRRPDGEPLQLRMGIHSGPVVSGVIGLQKFAWDLWGDTVNTAARMESHGLPGEIQVSQAAADRLRASFELEPRGEIQVKGKGPMATWLLKGRA